MAYGTVTPGFKLEIHRIPESMSTTGAGGVLSCTQILDGGLSAAHAPLYWHLALMLILLAVVSATFAPTPSDRIPLDVGMAGKPNEARVFAEANPATVSFYRPIESSAWLRFLSM